MNKKKMEVPRDKYNNVGVRATLNRAGLDNSKIGYDGEYVTYAGARLMKPEYEADGVSYAKQDDINSAINRAYKMDGVDVVPIAQYAGAKGVPQYAARFENGSVYLGGSAVPSFYESGGIAYGDRAKVDEAVSLYSENSGAGSFAGVEEGYLDNTSDLDVLLDDYLTRDDWSYNPEDDPAFISYRDAAQREGEAAYENILGNMSARTGGMLNSAAVSAAAQGYNSYLQSIQDKIPELQAESYERYSNDRDAELDGILKAYDVEDTKLRNTVLVRKEANDYARQNAKDEFGRKNDEYDLRQKDIYTDLYDEIMSAEVKQETANAQFADENAYEDYVQNQQQSMSSAREADKTDAETEAIRTDNIYRNAVVRGYFTEAEANYLGISKDTDPIATYRRFLMLGKK